MLQQTRATNPNSMLIDEAAHTEILKETEMVLLEVEDVEEVLPGGLHMVDENE